MRKLIIKLPDETAATFEAQPVIHMIPTNRESYLAFLARATDLHDGVAASLQVLTKLKGLDGLTAETAEGLRILAEIMRHLVMCEEVMQAFFEPGIAIATRDGRGERLQ